MDRSQPWADPLPHPAPPPLGLCGRAGFLLLVPLQGITACRTLTTATSIQDQTINQVTSQLSDLGASIAAATSPQDPQNRLKRIPGLPAESMLREDLRGQRQQAENIMLPQLNAALPLKSELVLQESLRKPPGRLPFAGLRSRSRRGLVGKYDLQLAGAEQAPLHGSHGWALSLQAFTGPGPLPQLHDGHQPSQPLLPPAWGQRIASIQATGRPWRCNGFMKNNHAW